MTFAPSVHIDTGEVELHVNGDPKRVVRFNPQDVRFAENFYALLKEFDIKRAEFTARDEKIKAEGEKLIDGLPASLPESFVMIREACIWLRGEIDKIFGAGTSQTAFGDALVLDVFEQFLAGVTPHIAKVRESKVAQYTQEHKERVKAKAKKKRK